MEKSVANIDGMEISVYSLNTIIVGSGVAGLNAADSLWSLGQRDVAILTEGLTMGTSINTGSDKQTYYKLTLAGGVPDSVKDMAETLYSGGAVHGDIALTEAALSARCFFKLVEAGVPFPHDGHGQYAGYKTDHDPRQRATSAGPLTSKYMAEALIRLVRDKGIAIFEGMLAIAILTDGEESNRSIGLLALDMNHPGEFVLFNCTNIIFATGGPAGIYESSVYPEQQFGALGIAFEAGARGINLTESQYGIASTKFRWNLSGSYQQVLPRYISTDTDGHDEKEFLRQYFLSEGQMLDAIFLKGYQWPFDPRKVSNCGSSLIDLLVYQEKEIKGRRVFLDFTQNPGCGEMDFSLLGSESHDYLKKSGILFGTPYDRLVKMNAPAVQLYHEHGIDLQHENLEIAVCAQHCNGGLLADIWWEGNIKHFFPIGEACGTFGVYRPGGSALNSTQVGSMRAAQRIALHYGEDPLPLEKFLSIAAMKVQEKSNLMQQLYSDPEGGSTIIEQRRTAQKRMTAAGAHIRSRDMILCALEDCRREIENFPNNSHVSSPAELADAFRNYDMLLTQYMFLCSIREYIRTGGGSRGSYLISDEAGELPEPTLPATFRHKLDDGQLSKRICEVWLDRKNLLCGFDWKHTRPIPEDDLWFETVWADYRNSYAVKNI